MYQPTAPVPPTSRWTGKKRALIIIAGAITGLTLMCAGLVTIGASDNNTPNRAAVAHAAATTTKATSYGTLTDREWKLLAKTPDQYAGDGFVVYGIVTQADAATGDKEFLAHAGGIQLDDPDGYDTNTLFTGAPAQLAKLVEGDQFTANVTARGAYSYDTQAGGNTTAPRLQVDTITITTPAPGDRPNE